jgi:hypothetical protein
MDRVTRLLGSANHATPIIEIGAGYNPIAPKADGWSTHVVDHCAQEELREKYAALGIGGDNIEPVDTVWQGGELHDAIPVELHGTFERLIGSHVIEHIPDVAGFLVALQHLLHKDGVIALAVPDRRYCFDYFKQHVMTGAVLDAFSARRTRHSLDNVWNHAAYSVLLDGLGARTQEPVREAKFMIDFDEAMERFRRFDNTPNHPYLDCHAWHFTPATFKLMILELGVLGVIDWHIEDLYGPEGCEFFVFLRRGAERQIEPSALRSRRMMLLREHLADQWRQCQFAVAGGLISPDTGVGTGASPAQVSELTRKLDELSASVQGLEVKLGSATVVLSQLDKALGPARLAWRWMHLRGAPK